MNRSIVLVACLSVLLVGCDRLPDAGEKLPVSTEADISAKTKAQQARMSGAFYEALVPKLKGCWTTVEGKGEIQFKLTYQMSSDTWDWQQAEVEKSNLSEKAQAAALDCMRTSARGSHFKADGHEAVATSEFVVHWGWPVPFPEDTSQLAEMISTGGGGPNPECPKSCFDCVNTPGVPGSTKCVATCSGYKTCQEDGTGNGCKMTPIGGMCATGWSGVWAGGVVIASNPEGLWRLASVDRRADFD